MSDMVIHPNHYISKSGLEAWDVIKDFTADLSGAEAWGTQQALKYLLRWKHKGGKEDLEKAVNYIQELIKDIEANEEKKKEIDSQYTPVKDFSLNPESYFINTIDRTDDMKERECWDCKHFQTELCDICSLFDHDRFEKK